MKLFKIVNEWDQCWLVVASNSKEAFEDWQADHNPYDNEGDQYCISTRLIQTAKEADATMDENPFVGVGVVAKIQELREKAKLEENAVIAPPRYTPDDDIPF